MGMRGRILAALVILAGLFSPMPTEAAGAECTGTACGVPQCWEPTVHARPGMARVVRVGCWGATGAKLITPAAHAQISDVSTEWSGLKLTIRPREDAPRADQATFEVAGHEGSVELTVSIEIKPLSENAAPVCEGDRKTQRSDGTGPVDLFLHPYCRDPDHDDFVMHGGGPGVHPEAPKYVPSGNGEANWSYRTATHDGSETGRVWAIDSLGARSQDALLEVTVGPSVDRLPDCMPGTAINDGSGVFPIFSRPGRIRRFGVLCDDPDGDPFATQVSALPQRGALALVPGLTSSSQYWGFEQWNDATYVPRDDSLEPDEFALTSTGARGSGPQVRMAIVPRPLPENSGGGCGWSGVNVAPGSAGVVEISCSDGDGDDLSAEVVGGPLHGTAGPPALLPDLYGNTKISVPYVPNPGYEGYDCVKVVIGDGNGLGFEISVDIFVAKPYELPTPPPLPLPPVPVPLPQLPPSPAPLPPGFDAIVRTYAKDVFGTDSVKRLPSPGHSRVYAPARLPRRELVREGRAPAIFVVCPGGCRIRSDARLYTGSRARGARRRTAAAAAAGQAQLLWLDLDRRQRTALRRAAAEARARFAVAVRAGGPARTSQRWIPITP